MNEKTKTTNYTIDELNRFYSEGESCDKELFSEQRSNILLSAGDHFTKKSGQFWSRIRDSKTLPQDQKLRITKNHTYKIVRTYINNLLSMAPGVKALPQDPKDLRHVKAAELSQSVWDFAKKSQDYKSKIASCAKSFIECGEVFVEIVFDPNKGRMVGYEQETDDDGFPLFTTPAGDQTQNSHDEIGQPHEPMASTNAVFTGDLVANVILPGNVIRAAEAKTIKESRFLCIRDMVHIKDLEKMVGDDEDKLKLITEHSDETFFVFDGQRNAYGQTRNQTLVRKFYFRPSIEFPNGYYYICTKEGVLFEGELPFGIFPIIYGGFDEISTTPRHRSIIKQLRPIQSEINRAASKIAETQITLGDDKVILQNGSKVTSGPQMPGIRTMFVTGQAPTIMAGRSGDQYLPYLAAQIAELYQVANVMEDSQETPGQDPWANLFRSIREKKKFSLYAEKFERFLVEWFECYISLAKEYFDENMLIPAIGKSEVINISEFKNQEPLFTRITAEPMSDDINSVMGKTLMYNHILQYVGPQLSKDDIGKVIRQMPLANSDEAFDEFTLDYDTATNIVLALDRGEQVQAAQWDNGQYILKMLAARQKKADFRTLSPQIQQAYAALIQQYEQIEAKKAQDLKAAQSQFIPSGGAMIKVAYYVKDPTNPDRSIQATVPAEAVDWLINQLSTQGSAQAQLMQQGPGVRDDIANMISAGGIPPRQLTPPMPQAGGAPQPNVSAQQQTPGSPAWLAMRGGGAH